jgi:hypothetical protein
MGYSLHVAKTEKAICCIAHAGSSQPRLAPHSQSLDSCPANAPPIESLESIQSGHDNRPADFGDFNMMVDDDFATTGGADSGIHFYISILFVAYML